MLESVGVAQGLLVLHLFCARAPDSDDAEVLQALQRADEAGAQVVTVATLGHKSQLCFMGLHSDAWVLRDLQTGLEAAGLRIVDSYVSITELSEYALGLPAEMAEMRLNPKLPPPGKPAWCFYPMSKRRNPGQNWYELGFDDRKQLMHEHGASGRKFAGRIVQLVTSSTGLDDWEWGVTLFGSDIAALKDTVYTMRYDRASAVYADFGPFVTGLVGSAEEIVARTR
ncbi:MAG: chlorite dismutase family protein [Acidimicrobiaceae bacterium]|nr:chlorite dismutase family protein [Acidimicrobiaceae bacterium]MCY4176186.1 chlorite dismutase family protein [Acidimicrobiaceae bacterium]MCY4281165.1 chlorite dismutase family protein [Acidimicrobiaceae bacterium]MCY4294390.1 chlorite dismutase family protein [Acidimicrobiaceae bacterium]